jgi:putative flippase GtrA
MHLARYLVVGMANTLTGLLVIYACKWMLGAGDVSANMVGYGVGILLGFQLNKKWTFSHGGDYLHSLLRYCMVLACAYLVNLATVLYSITAMDLNSYLAQALGIGPYTLIGYLGSRYYAFPMREPKCNHDNIRDRRTLL